MSEFARTEGRRASGGRTITIEEYRRREQEQQYEKPSPSGGSRLLERIRIPADERAWMAQAACKGKPTSWWYPDSSQYMSEDAQRARRICAGCPVIDDCRAFAERHSELGTWGRASQRARAADRPPAPPPPPKPSKPAKAATKPTQRRVPPPRPPLSPMSTALLAALADGHWADLDDIVDKVRSLVPDDRARKAQVGELRAKRRSAEPGDLGPAGVRAGQRIVVRQALANLARSGRVEGVRSTYRLAAKERAS